MRKAPTAELLAVEKQVPAHSIEGPLVCMALHRLGGNGAQGG